MRDISRSFNDLGIGMYNRLDVQITLLATTLDLFYFQFD